MTIIKNILRLFLQVDVKTNPSKTSGQIDELTYKSLVRCTPLFMIRNLLVILLIHLFHSTSYGQKSRDKDPSIVITFFGNKNPFRDSSFLAKIANVYGKNSAVLEHILKDTSYIRKFDTAFLRANGEFISSSYKIHLPIKYLNCISDYERIFSDSQKSELDSLISRFNAMNAVNIAIVTIDSSWTSKADFDALIEEIHHAWGLEKKSIEEGIVIGISKGLRIIRINNGPGISEKLTDIATKKIIYDIIIPEYRQGDFFGGTKRGLLTIMQKIR